MFPRPRATIPGTAEAASTRTARISTSSIRSSSGRSPVGNGFCVVNPALLTRKSMGRALSRRRSATRSTCSRSDRSAGSTSTSTPYRSRRATATASSRPTSRETRTSPYPSAVKRRTKAFPIPEVAPVTSAVGKDPSYDLPPMLDYPDERILTKVSITKSQYGPRPQMRVVNSFGKANWSIRPSGCAPRRFRSAPYSVFQPVT